MNGLFGQVLTRPNFGPYCPPHDTAEFGTVRRVYQRIGLYEVGRIGSRHLAVGYSLSCSRKALVQLCPPDWKVVMLAN